MVRNSCISCSCLVRYLRSSSACGRLVQLRVATLSFLRFVNPVTWNRPCPCTSGEPCFGGVAGGSCLTLDIYLAVQEGSAGINDCISSLIRARIGGLRHRGNLSASIHQAILSTQGNIFVSTDYLTTILSSRRHEHGAKLAGIRRRC